MAPSRVLSSKGKISPRKVASPVGTAQNALSREHVDYFLTAALLSLIRDFSPSWGSLA